MASVGTAKAGIRRFIVVWMVGFLLSLIVLDVSFILSTNRLQKMVFRITSEAHGMSLAYQLELAVLGERREDLLWRETGHARHRAARTRELENADAIAKALLAKIRSQSDDWGNIVGQAFSRYMAAAQKKPSPDVETLSTIADSLLSALQQYKNSIRVEMLGTRQSSRQLNRTVETLSLFLVVTLTLAGIIATAVLVNRIIRPSLSLAKTVAEYGEGEFSRRAEIFRDDELGLLSQTFNEMADNIDKLRKEQLSLTGSVAHDLKNSLTVVGGAARMLQKKELTRELQAEWHERIAEQVDHLENLVSDLMDSIQVEAGYLALSLDPFDLNVLVAKVVEGQSTLAPGHHFVFEPDEDLPPVPGDEERLRRVALNVISNAVKYAPRGSTVVLRTEKMPGRVIFSVTDEGPGIKSEEVSQVFQPFKRLSQTRDIAHGAGLGLFSAGKIVQAHGGKIRIRSEEGRGTTVEIELPLGA